MGNVKRELEVINDKTTWRIGVFVERYSPTISGNPGNPLRILLLNV
jgi:hypothetical protein